MANLVATAGNDILTGNSDQDTVSYGSATAGVTVSLAVSGPQVTGGSGSDTLVGIENLIGSKYDDQLNGDGGANNLFGGAGNDTLMGGGGDDVLRGGLGDDIFDGGDGFDIADFNDASSGVTVSLAISGAQNTGAGSDTLGNIEGLLGSGFADTLTGDDQANRLLGSYGNDTLRGAGGDDVLDGGDGDDILDGGAGFDTVDYSQSSYSVTVDLGLGTAFGPSGSGSGSGLDTLTNIEKVIGTGGADTLKAGAVGATLMGGSGADSLYSGAGDDTLDGGDGDDVFYLGAGADHVTGGAGSDTVNFVAGASALSLDLTTLWASGQYAVGGLTISGVELMGSVTGGGMNDTVTVGDAYTGAVTMSGGAGDDVLTGGGGRDILTGGAGADTLNGGAGDDTLVIDAGDRAADGGSGVDTLSFEWGTSYASQALNIDLTNLWTGGAGLINGAEIRGVEKIDYFYGSQLADRVIFGAGPSDLSTRLGVSLGDGDDYAVGGAGGDGLNGDAGNDTLYGGDGADSLFGGDGADQLFGGNGDDTFYASANDTIDGGAGRDVLRFSVDISRPAWNIDLRGLWAGGTGTINGGTVVGVEDTYDIGGTSKADTIIVGDGLVTKITYYYGEIPGRDAFNGLILRGYDGDDTIVGSGGADKIYGDRGADKISGGAGDDIIVLDGKDTIDGGAGVDTIVMPDEYHRTAEALDLDLRGNWDGVAGSSITNVEKFFGGYGSDYDDRIIVGDKYVLNGVEINGGAGDDFIVGSGANDKLSGSQGADTLSGGGGDDTLDGFLGDDILDGGAGNDTAIFDGNAVDFSWTTNADGSLTIRDLRDPHYFAFGGVDTLRNIEVLQFSDKSVTLASKAGVTLAGTAGADQLTGGDFDDVLSGAGGDDVLIGGLGDDVLDGGDGIDIVSYANASGPVRVLLGMTAQQNTGMGLDKLISIEGIIGSAFADFLNGGSGANILKGGGGDDVIGGGDGNDDIDGGDGYDTANYIGLSTSYSLTQSADGSWVIKDLTGILQSGTDTLHNVEALKFDDKIVNLPGAAGVISGSAGDDSLLGTRGNDTFRAGDGNDSLSGGFGDDVYDGGAGRDFVGFTTAANGITVDLAITTAQDTGEGRDTFISIEGLFGSQFADTLKGDGVNNQINGGAGNDVIDGRGGDDNLSGESGNDIVHGGDGNDIVSGGSGDDQVFGDAGDDFIPLFSETTGQSSGDDLIDGGDGFDTISAAWFSDGVTIDLGRTDRQAIATGSWITLKNVENVNGSLVADRLTGNAGGNLITGDGGNDIIYGGDGFDTAVYWGKASDYSITHSADGSWTVKDLRSGTPDGQDTLKSIESLRFSDKTVSLSQLIVDQILRGDSVIKGYELEAKVAEGTLTLDGAIASAIKAAGSTTSVATLAYEFFTGKVPSQPGIDYLVSPTGLNANNLNSAYYQSFNYENRYINFAVNLGKVGEGKEAFAAKYGSLSLFDATREAYKTIFGAAPTDAKIHAMIDSRADYLAAYGGDGTSGIGTKAAMVGWLLAEAQKADLGVMARANDAWLTDLADGSAPFAIDILDPAKGYYKADFIFGGG